MNSVIFSKNVVSNVIYSICVVACFLPFMTPVFALLTGVLVSLIGFRDFWGASYSSLLLKVSIVFIGFGLSLEQVISASLPGIAYTLASVAFVIILGLLLIKLLNSDRQTGLLIAAGNAICGANAIAAIAPIIHAKPQQVSISLAVVFVLNGIALITFPYIGSYFEFSERAFAFWAAISIHDTSSVVGACAVYGDEALEAGTTIKLIRTVWIIPMAVFIALNENGGSLKSIKIPWFILFFALSIVFANVFTHFEPVYEYLQWLGRKGMNVALLIIGSRISIKNIMQAGSKSFLLGVIMWLVLSVTLFFVFKDM